MKALSNKDCMFISQMEIIYIEVLADLISNTKMVATNGDYPPKSQGKPYHWGTLRIEVGWAMPTNIQRYYFGKDFH